MLSVRCIVKVASWFAKEVALSSVFVSSVFVVRMSRCLCLGVVRSVLLLVMSLRELSILNAGSFAMSRRVSVYCATT